MRDPCDIAACTQTSQLYVPDVTAKCIWRVSSDGEDIKRWWTQSESDTFKPRTLSVTSSRLLVTSFDPSELLQLDVSGDEVRRVRLPDYMDRAQHAVESVTGTFIVSHDNTQLLNDQWQVSEVNNTTGDVLRQFSPLSLGEPLHIASDSQGNIIVADHDNSRILLLDAQLALRRVIIDERQLNNKWPPQRLCYMQHTRQLLVGFKKSVLVFDVLE